MEKYISQKILLRNSKINNLEKKKQEIREIIKDFQKI